MTPNIQTTQATRLSTRAGEHTGKAIAFVGHCMATAGNGLGNYGRTTVDSTVRHSASYAALRASLAAMPEETPIAVAIVRKTAKA
jgi:hypothetical protein